MKLSITLILAPNIGTCVIRASSCLVKILPVELVPTANVSFIDRIRLYRLYFCIVVPDKLSEGTFSCVAVVCSGCGSGPTVL